MPLASPDHGMVRAKRRPVKLPSPYTLLPKERRTCAETGVRNNAQVPGDDCMRKIALTDVCRYGCLSGLQRLGACRTSTPRPLPRLPAGVARPDQNANGALSERLRLTTGRARAQELPHCFYSLHFTRGNWRSKWEFAGLHPDEYSLGIAAPAGGPRTRKSPAKITKLLG